jgi:maltose alpha-D-glucosyltransferase/alpha-amylase
MGDDISLPDRDGVRTPMQWEDSQNGGFSTNTILETPLIHGSEYSSANINVDRSIKTVDSIWNHLRMLIKIRKSETVFATNSINLVDFENQHILSFYREDQTCRILFIHNLSHESQELNSRLLGLENDQRSVDLLTKKYIKPILDGGSVNLTPYQSIFLKTVGRP